MLATNQFMDSCLLCPSHFGFYEIVYAAPTCQVNAKLTLTLDAHAMAMELSIAFGLS